MGTKQQNKKTSANEWSEKKKNIVTVLVLIILAGLIVGICLIAINCKDHAESADSKETESQTEASPAETLDPVASGYPESQTPTDYISLTVQYVNNRNQVATEDIVIRLRPDVAPITVENFKELVASGFYNGLTFHRIVPSFMIQGGDPMGTGSGGSANTIKGEFSENGVSNTLSHTRGVISMARSEHYDSASSQFFIVQEDSTYLDGSYAAFGEVIYGMDTVDGIAKTPRSSVKNGRGEQSAPVTPPVILKACFVTPSENT